MFKTLILLLSLLFTIPAEAARIYVIYGQGEVMTSLGMKQLASRLPGRVSTHNWEDPGSIVADIKRLPKGESIAIVGYSLGANATTWISNAVNRKIDLIVAYDPSIYSKVLPAGSNVYRVLLYHNNGSSTYGHARIKGPQVETTEINMNHLSVDFSEALHQKTIAAVSRLK